MLKLGSGVLNLWIDVPLGLGTGEGLFRSLLSNLAAMSLTEPLLLVRVSVSASYPSIDESWDTLEFILDFPMSLSSSVMHPPYLLIWTVSRGGGLVIFIQSVDFNDFCPMLELVSLLLIVG